MTRDYTLPEDILDDIAEMPKAYDFTSYLPNTDTGCDHDGPFLHDKREHWELCMRCGEKTYY